LEMVAALRPQSDGNSGRGLELLWIQTGQSVLSHRCRSHESGPALTTPSGSRPLPRASDDMHTTPQPLQPIASLPGSHPQTPAATENAVGSPIAEHRAYLALASAAIATGLLLSLAGCQTPTQPTYGNGMVPPPATGAVGQPAPYGPFGAPQVSYAQTPMPGPTNSLQGAAPTGAPPPPAATGYPPPAPANAATTQPAASATAGSTWGWPQGQQPPPQQPPPTTPTGGQPVQQPPQTYNGTPPQAAAAPTQPPPAGYQQPPPGYQQPVAGQPQPWTGQYQQPPQAPQQQTTNGSWWPFSDPNAIPPARSTPASVPRY